MLTPLEKLLERLSDTSEDFAVIVEGKRDVLSLKMLGIRKVVSINRFRGFEELAEKLHNIGVRRVVILTDFDKKGEEIRKKLLLHLTSWEIREEVYPRKRLREITGVKTIESLYRRVLEMLGGDADGKDIRRLRKVRHPRKARSKGSRGQARRDRGYLRPDRRALRRGARA